VLVNKVSYKIAAAIVAMLAGVVAKADSITYTGSGVGSGVSLSATATFKVVGGDVVLVLTNTGTQAAVDPGSVLTGVFFTSSTNLTLSGHAANLTGYPGGSRAYVPNSDAMDPNVWMPFNDSMHQFVNQGGSFSDSGNTYDTTGNVGGEWARAGISLDSYNYGVSSSGFGSPAGFGPGDRFDVNQNLAGPDSLDGLEFGLIPFIGGQPNGNVMTTPLSKDTNEPLGANSVTFDLGTAPGFVAADITGVRFQYGTALNEPSFIGNETGHVDGDSAPLPVPAQAGLLLLASLAILRKMGVRKLTHAIL
jgi:hypothetical protein